MFERNYEPFLKRHEYYRLARLPKGKVSVGIPAEFIDYDRGVIDFEGFRRWLNDHNDDQVVIDYEIE